MYKEIKKLFNNLSFNLVFVIWLQSVSHDNTRRTKKRIFPFFPQILQPYCPSPSAAERPYLPSLLARDGRSQGSEGRQGGIRIQGSRRGGSIQREAGCPGEEKENQVKVENHGRLNSHVQSQVRFSMKYPSMYLVFSTVKSPLAFKACSGKLSGYLFCLF